MGYADCLHLMEKLVYLIAVIDAQKTYPSDHCSYHGGDETVGVNAVDVDYDDAFVDEIPVAEMDVDGVVGVEIVAIAVVDNVETL